MVIEPPNAHGFFKFFYRNIPQYLYYKFQIDRKLPRVILGVYYWSEWRLVRKNVIFSTFGRIIIKFFKRIMVKWIMKNIPFFMYFQTYKTVFWNKLKKWVKKIENWLHVEIAKNSNFPDLSEAIYQRRNKKNGRFKMFLVSWHPLEHFYIFSSFCDIRSSKITDNAF